MPLYNVADDNLIWIEFLKELPSLTRQIEMNYICLFVVCKLKIKMKVY